MSEVRRGEGAANDFAAAGRTRMLTFPFRTSAARTRAMPLVRQMIVPGSAIAKIIHDGGKHHLFVRMGAFNGVLVALIGPLSMIFRQRHLISAFNIISLLSAPLTVSGAGRGCVTSGRAGCPSGSTGTYRCE